MARVTGQPAEGKLCKKCGAQKVWQKNGQSLPVARCRTCRAKDMNRYRALDPEKFKAMASEWRKTNPDKVRETKRKTRQRPEYREAHRKRMARCRAEDPEHYRACQREWARNNPEKIAVTRYKRKAAKLNAPSDGIALRVKGRVCYICLNAPATAVDHIVPLAKGGTDLITNKAPACTACNAAKGSRVWPGVPGWANFLSTRRSIAETTGALR